MTFIVAVLLGLVASASLASEPAAQQQAAAKQDRDQLVAAWMLERTCRLGGCSGVVLPPLIDRDGKKHWFVASAAHCANDSGKNYEAKFPYPSYNARTVWGREIYRRRGDKMPDMTDILIVELFPKSDLPYADLANLDHPKSGLPVVVTGFPALAPKTPQIMRWKEARINQVGNGVIGINSFIWPGNSGGPLWLLGKNNKPVIAGTSSTSDFRNSAHFSDTRSIHEGYCAAAKEVGADCPLDAWVIFGGGGRRQPNPNPTPYQPPPNEDYVHLQQTILLLEQRIVVLENQPPPAPPKAGLQGKRGLNGEDGLPGDDGQDGQDGQDGTPGNDGVDGLDGATGIAGDDGREGEIGRDGVDGQPGTIDVIVRWEDGTVIGTHEAAQSGGTVVVNLSEKLLER